MKVSEVITNNFSRRGRMQIQLLCSDPPEIGFCAKFYRVGQKDILYFKTIENTLI